MTITLRPLTTVDDWQAAETLQRRALGRGARSVWTAPMLAAVAESGGLLLGAWADDGVEPQLRGALVDLLAEIERYPAMHTAVHGVAHDARGRGVGTALRHAERSLCARRGVDLVLWGIDPLRGAESHLALNKLGGIGTRYRRNFCGPVHDRANAGLATDRLMIEWWIDAPRVRSLLDDGNPPAHHDLGLHRMDVITKTKALGSGLRALVGTVEAPAGSHVLVEVPVDLDALRESAPEIAREWRIGIRELLERLLDGGYVVVGFIHEAGRSFHLLERSDKGRILGR